MRVLDLGISMDATSATRIGGFWKTFQWGTAGVFVWISDHLDGKGGNSLLEIYCLMILLDYATGVLASLIAGRCKSGVALKGVAKKLMGLLAVGFGHSMDLYLVAGTAMPHGNLFLMLTSRLMIGYEIISVGENIAAAGIVLPAAIREMMGRSIAQTTGPVNLPLVVTLCRYPSVEGVAPQCRYPDSGPEGCETRCPDRATGGK